MVLFRQKKKKRASTQLLREEGDKGKMSLNTDERERNNRGLIRLTALTCRNIMLPNELLEAERARAVSPVGPTCHSSAQQTDAGGGG